MMQLPMYGFKIKNKIYRTISGGDTKWLTDSLQNLEQYHGLHKNMDTVIDFEKCDLTALPDGKR